MGIKALTQKYDIKHIVQLRDDCICIGSLYCGDIIKISFEGKIIKPYKDGYSINRDLDRYQKAMESDEKTGELKRLIDLKDIYEINLPVFYTENGRVIKTFCEQYSYPNITHNGLLMYDNTFFKTKQEARKYLLKETRLGVKYSARRNVEVFHECRRLTGRTLKYIFRELKEWIIARIIW
jgi:hypothetical protein